MLIEEKEQKVLRPFANKNIENPVYSLQTPLTLKIEVFLQLLTIPKHFVATRLQIAHAWVNSPQVRRVGTYQLDIILGVCWGGALAVPGVLWKDEA